MSSYTEGSGDPGDAVNNQLPEKARAIAMQLDGDEGTDLTYDEFKPDGLLDRLTPPYSNRGVLEVEHLYKDEGNDVEIGAGNHKIDQAMFTGNLPKTRVYHDGELVLDVADQLYGDERENAVEVYKPGVWEDELDELARDLETDDVTFDGSVDDLAEQLGG